VESGLTRESIKQVVQEHLNGKRYFHYEAEKKYGLCEEDQQKLINELREVKQKKSYFEKN
jgi:exodeoxyribonuclease V beta subunit